jgi:hypothetical protein
VPRTTTRERGGSVERIDGASPGDRVEADHTGGLQPRSAVRPGLSPLENGEHVRQCLDRTCGVAIAFLSREARMQVIVERCAGLDVHRETVVACVLVGSPGLRPSKEIHTTL